MSWSQAVERTVTGLGYELVDVERTAGGLLRVLIDRVPGRAYPTGEHEFVTVEDCEAVTRQLQYVLEVENADYVRLEVSSPGLDRPLKRPEDYARFAGQMVAITLKLPFQGRKKYEGTLLAAEPGEAGADAAAGADSAGATDAAEVAPIARPASGWQLLFHDGKVEQVLDFNFEEVREARLVPVFDFKGRRGKGAPAGPQSAGSKPVDGEPEQ